MKDAIKILGKMNLKKYRLIDGILRLEDELDGRNTVVDVGRERLCDLLGGASTVGITKAGVGTGSSTPTVADTGLTGQFLTTIDTITYPTTTSVKFAFDIDLGDYNGNTIREWGLFTTDSVLFSRILKASIDKESDIYLTGEWSITFI